MGTREIKFRAKNTDTKEWVYGYLADETYINNINTIDLSSIEVDSDTVGQFTGLKDKNGKEIYEGDIVKNESAGFCGVIKFKDSAFIIDIDKIKGTLFACLQTGSLEIIGNIHDNPELLKGGKA